jgi:hypothetical protein
MVIWVEFLWQSSVLGAQKVLVQRTSLSFLMLTISKMGRGGERRGGEGRGEEGGEGKGGEGGEGSEEKIPSPTKFPLKQNQVGTSAFLHTEAS